MERHSALSAELFSTAYITAEPPRAKLFAMDDRNEMRKGVTRPRVKAATPPAPARPPTPEEQEKCYGTLRVCPRAHLCNLADACSSRANEEASDIHYQMTHISVPFMSFDSGEADGTSNGRRRHGKTSPDLSAEESDAEREAEMVEDDSGDANAKENGATVDIGGVTIAESSLEDVRKVTDAICSLAITSPASFNCLVRKIYTGAKQIDIARQDGKSRQAVNKKLLAELGISQKRNARREELDAAMAAAEIRREDAEEALARRDDAFASLTFCELLAFRMLRGAGMRESEVASVLGVSESTVFHFRRRMLESHGIDATPPRRTRRSRGEADGR